MSYVGIDVSKDRLDVHVLHCSLVVVAATGGFEAVVAAALGAAGAPLAQGAQGLRRSVRRAS